MTTGTPVKRARRTAKFVETELKEIEAKLAVLSEKRDVAEAKVDVVQAEETAFIKQRDSELEEIRTRLWKARKEADPHKSEWCSLYSKKGYVVDELKWLKKVAAERAAKRARSATSE